MLNEVPPAIEDESQVLHRRSDADVNPSYRDVGLRVWCIPTAKKAHELGLVQRHLESQLPDPTHDHRNHPVFPNLLYYTQRLIPSTYGTGMRGENGSLRCGLFSTLESEARTASREMSCLRGPLGL